MFRMQKLILQVRRPKQVNMYAGEPIPCAPPDVDDFILLSDDECFILLDPKTGDIYEFTDYNNTWAKYGRTDNADVR